MRGYSAELGEDCACARLEGVDASYKDLAQVCGRVRGKDASWAVSFLEKAAKAEIPVLYKRHNKRLGHRRELGGKKGRYPKKAAMIVLKLLKTAVSNGVVKGLGEDYRIVAANANKKYSYPRMAPKGRRARAYYELARLEMVLKPTSEVPKGVEVTPPKEAPKEEKPKEVKKEGNAPPKKEEPTPKKEAPKKEEQTKQEKRPLEPKASAPKTPKEISKEKEDEVRTVKHPGGGMHKHGLEKEQEAAKAHHDRYAYEHGKGKKTVVKKEG
jgi:large subunit ribosomal protein L22